MWRVHVAMRVSSSWHSWLPIWCGQQGMGAGACVSERRWGDPVVETKPSQEHIRRMDGTDLGLHGPGSSQRGEGDHSRRRYHSACNWSSRRPTWGRPQRESEALLLQQRLRTSRPRLWVLE